MKSITENKFNGRNCIPWLKENLIIMKSVLIFFILSTVCSSASQLSNLKNSTANIEVSQQSKQITGTVLDEQGEPIMGANVIEKGRPTNGTITNVDGKFTLNISEDGTFIVSYIGYNSQEIKVAGKTMFSVNLEENSQALDEVVVVGYGSVKKSNLTNSVSKITNESIQERPITTMSEALQGQLAGVQSQATGGGIPGKELTIRIRGLNSINGDSSPLYVIDGVPRDNMNDLNPSDIASIQVLKDASATSIYGARGANGVIMIETKKGAGKPSVSFEGYYGFQTAEKKLDLMSGYEWIAYNMYMRNANYLRSGGSMSDPMSSRPLNYQIPDSWSNYTASDFTDWQSEVLQTAPIQSYQASASAKGDMGNVYFSIGYMDQDGIIKYTNYNKTNMRLNASLNITKKLRIGINMSASMSDQQLAGGSTKESSVHHALMISPLMNTSQGTRDWGTPAEYLVGATYPNPVEQLKYTNDDTKYTRLAASLYGEYDIINGLTFKTQYSNNYDGMTYEFYQPGNVTYNNGYVTKGNNSTSTIRDWTIQNTLTYDKSFADSHHINVLLGQSAEKQNYFASYGKATGWPYESIETLNVATTAESTTTTRATYANASFFGRLNYDYKEKYLFSASVRRDGSSRFGINTKWGTFPSFSAGWKVNEESFMKDAKWISLLKLRAAWGTSGNDRIGTSTNMAIKDYPSVALLGNYNTSWSDALVSGVAAQNIANNDLQWERTKSLDFGVDFYAFKNRLQVNVDYYINTTDNLLFSVPIPYTTGFSSYTTNLGSVRNTGIEVDITSHNLTGPFKWETNLNLSHNRNKVLDMGSITSFTVSSYDAQFITKVGGPISQFYCYRTDGYLTADDFDSNGKALVPIISGQEEGGYKIVDQNKDGSINSSDLKPYGNNLPDISYGFTNRFSYKNFDLSILVQGQIGGDILYLGGRHNDCGFLGRRSFSRWVNCYKPDYESEYGSGENPIPTAYLESHGLDMSWDGKTPNSFGFQNNTDQRIYDATYLRFKNVTLGYTLPKKVLGKSIVSSAKFYVSLDNLYTIDDYPGFTPESNSFGNGTTKLGVDYSTYPLSRRCIFGINVIF